jgi:hypothetical protein
MWSRGIAGVVLCLDGAALVAQGTGVMHGSWMSGHGQYRVLGAVAILIGLAMLVWANHVRTSRAKQRS